MTLFLFLLAIGLVGLYFGSQWLVTGSSRLAKSFGIPSLVVGLTVVAYGTSAPELIVSLTAALQGDPDISIGNVVGSNISNIALILGLTGIILPIGVNRQLLVREIPFLLVISVLMYIFARSGGQLGRIEGIIFFIGAMGFTFASYWFSQQEEKPLVTEELPVTIPVEVNRLLELGRVAV